LKSLDNDSKMRRLIKPLAIFEDGDKDEFIAIAEGVDIPMYIFTYQIEMVQFYFEDPSATLDEFLLDHSLIARKHAQTIATLIADESRLSTHNYEDPEEVFETLIRHQREVRIRYDNVDSEELHLPKGMTEHDVYLL
jgi:hypothetical protein